MKNTTLCYIQKDDCYLMLHRIKKVNDCNKDKWIGIGGHFEDYESPFDCAIREIREETGLSVHDLDYRGIISFCSPDYETEQMHLFTATDFSGELIDCDEGVLEWIERKRLMSLPMWDGDKIFLDLIAANVPFFSLKLVYSHDGELLSHDLRFTGEKEPVIISACLLGCACRYDGKSKPLDPAVIDELRDKYALIPICPEQLGGLPTPRKPCEKRDERVMCEDGADMTDAYRRGAKETLRLASLFGARKAILKAKSPSCGSGEIYDGTFTRTITHGDGVTASLFKASGIEIIAM